MITDNERFKIILHDARLVCLSKLQLIEEKFGKDHSEVSVIRQEIEKVIGHFDNPALWLNPIPFDEMEITRYIIAVDAADPSNLTGFLADVRTFITYLEEQVLQAPIAGMESNQTSDFNQKVLDALLQSQRNIGGRKVFFKNQGTDLDNDPAFLVMQEEQRPPLAQYRELLKDNGVQATESDGIIFNRISEAIKQTTILDQFFALYQMLTRTIVSKIPADPIA